MNSFFISSPRLPGGLVPWCVAKLTTEVHWAAQSQSQNGRIKVAVVTPLTGGNQMTQSLHLSYMLGLPCGELQTLAE